MENISNKADANAPNSTAIAHADKVYINNAEVKIDLYSRIFTASANLLNWKHRFGTKTHLARTETEDLFHWISAQDIQSFKNVALLSGTAGTGKSVVLHDLCKRLQEENIPFLGLKADLEKFDTYDSLNKNLNLSLTIEEALNRIADENDKVVLIIDQIDALSQCLSSDRTPINTLDKLIFLARQHKNIRVVISCRPYDMQYDPLLSKYAEFKRFSMSLLSYEHVCSILNDFNRSIPNENSQLALFLSIPLNLELYVSYVGTDNGNEDITTQKLYDTIWRSKITNISNNSSFTRKSLIKCLDDLSQSMFDNQRLSISKNNFEDDYTEEIEYLLTHGLIVSVGNGNILTFLHQSFFDYVLARIFCDSKKTLSNLLDEEHQGLFIRGRIRQILNYLHEVNPDAYIKEIERIILRRKDNNSYYYRYHIRLLALNTMGGFHHLLEEETSFAMDSIITDLNLRTVFVESIYSPSWLTFLTENESIRNALIHGDTPVVESLFKLCCNLQYEYPQEVADNLIRLSKPYTPTSEKFLIQVMSQLNNKIALIALKEVFVTLSGDYKKMICPSYLKYMFEYDSTFAKEQIKYYLKESVTPNEEGETNYFRNRENTLDDYSLWHQIEKLKEKRPLEAFLFYLESVEIIDKYSKHYLRVDEPEFTVSVAYWSFSNKSRLYHHEDLVNELFNLAKIHACKEPAFFEDIISRYQGANSAIIQCVLIEIVRSNLTVFSRYVPFFLSERFIKPTHLTYLDYLVKKLIKESFELLSSEEQDLLIARIMDVEVPYEKTPLSKDVNRNGYPLTRIGRFCQGLLQQIPSGLLSRWPTAEKFLKEKNISFGTNENEAPSGVQTHCGWSAYKKEAYQKMKDDDWLRTFKKCTKDNHFDWDKPTLTGNAMSLRSYAEQNPTRFISIVKRALSDKSINLLYPSNGIEGILKGGGDIHIAEELTRELIKRYLSEPEGKNEVLFNLMRNMDYFIKANLMPEDFVVFLCDIVRNTKDEEDGEEERTAKDVYNVGINRVRGRAASILVDLSDFKEYEDKIFDTLNECRNASLATRGAIIFRQAYLNNLCVDRNLDLYLNLLHDYPCSLLAIEIHDAHPLLYFLNTKYNDERLQHFFAEAVKHPASHKALAILFWVAWCRNYDHSKELLYGLLNNSVEARCKIISFLSSSKEDGYKDKVMEFLETGMGFDNQELGRQYEISFSIVERYGNDLLLKYLNLYANSSMSKYAGHEFLDIMKDKVCKQFPKDCIRLLALVYNRMLGQESLQYNYTEILSIIVSAYDNVRKYSKRSPECETALDIMDKLLEVEDARFSLARMLTQLDN